MSVLSALLQAMTQQAGVPPDAAQFGPTLPQAPPPMALMPDAMGPPPAMVPMPGRLSEPPPQMQPMQGAMGAPQDMPNAPSPMGPLSQAPPMSALGPPPPQAPPAHDWKAQLPQLLMALAGLAGAGNNPYGAAAYLGGMRETQEHQASMAQHEAEQQAIADRLQREDEFKRQQFALSRHDKLTADEEAQRKERATFISGLLQKASEYDDPEQAAAFLKSQEAIGKEYGVNTSALPVIQSPAAIQRTQKGINEAFTAMQKQYKDEMFAPGWGDGVSIDVNGHQMSGADVLRRQTVLAKNNGALDPPMPDTGTGQEGMSLADRYRTFKQKTGHWPGASDRTQIQLDQDHAVALARKVSGDTSGNALEADAKMQAILAKMVPGTPSFKIAQDLAYGRLTMSQFRSLYANMRKTPEVKQALYFKATQLNDQFNPAAFEMGFRFAADPATQRALASVDNVLPNLQKAVDVSDQIGRYDEPTVNKYLAEGRFQWGDKKVSDFRQLQKLLGDEVGLALGAGGMTDMKLQLGLDVVNPNLSPQVFFSNMQRVQDFLINKKMSWLKQAGIYGTPEMNPGAQTDVKPLTSTTAPPYTLTTSGPFAPGQVRKRNDGSIVKLLRKAPDGTWDTQPVGP